MLRAGDRIGDRYALTYPIGRGGMGEVWAGHDGRLDRPVAIKFLRLLEVPESDRGASKRHRAESPMPPVTTAAPPICSATSHSR